MIMIVTMIVAQVVLIVVEKKMIIMKMRKIAVMSMKGIVKTIHTLYMMKLVYNVEKMKQSIRTYILVNLYCMV